MTEAAALQNIETLLQQNRKQDALREYKRLMDNAGARFDLWINYASFLFRCGQFEESIAITHKANSIKPTAEAYHNLGCALAGLGRSAEAITALKTALHYNYRNPDTHIGLAKLHEQAQQHLKSIDHYQIGISLGANHPQDWIALARNRAAAGRTPEALSALRSAHALDPKSDALWIAYGKLFQILSEYDIDQNLVNELTTVLYHPQVNPDILTNITINIFFQQAVVKTLCMAMTEVQTIPNFKTLLADASLNWLFLNLPLTSAMLTQFVAMNEQSEDFLAAMRGESLRALDEPETLALLQKLLPFYAALACQCFLNEYISNETGAETTRVETLRTKIENNADSITAIEICIYGCYRPLMTLKNAQDLQNLFAGKEVLATLMKIQITEPSEEEEIKKQLKTLTPIDDGISLLVKEQYESNPYPRWNKTSVVNDRDFKAVMRYLFPYLEEKAFSKIDESAPKSLVAGCGTGRQPIETKMMYKNLDITAIDITASSLAYAVRKTREYNLEDSIHYGIGDILKLHDLKQNFDIIFCGGVLHHMKDPMAGWRALNDCLKPGGFMLIALYSELARRNVVHAREFIKERGYRADIEGIRACRSEIRMMTAHHPIRALTKWTDFYTASMFRDLAFHVQEHRFTPLKLKECVDALGLEFLGFQFADRSVLSQYRTLYPDDPHGRNLKYWDDFERQNPDIFITMYHLWLRKPD